MGTEQRLEFEGRTLKEAIDLACAGLAIQHRELEYSLNADHFRGGADTVKIVAWRRSHQVQEIGEQARALLNGILDRMGFRGNIEIEVSDEAIRAILVTDEASMLIGKGGQTLDALQHLINKALVRTKSDKRILIDVENYRERREHSLKYVAQKICEKILQERCNITLKPMNAYDRRLVHMEVSRYPELESQSLGEGQMKRVQIHYVGAPGSGQ